MALAASGVIVCPALIGVSVFAGAAAVDKAAATLRKAPTAFLEALNASGALRSASVVLQLANASNFADVRRAVAGSTTLASYARH